MHKEKYQDTSRTDEHTCVYKVIENVILYVLSGIIRHSQSLETIYYDKMENNTQILWFLTITTREKIFFMIQKALHTFQTREKQSDCHLPSKT